MGNIYRPNTAPLANLTRALEILTRQLEMISDDRDLKKCEIILLGDLNINLLNFNQHSQTKEYLEMLISRGFLPIIILPTRIFDSSATLIDHIFTNIQSEIYQSFIIMSDLSDHFPVIFVEHNHNNKLPTPPKLVRQINEKTIPKFCETLGQQKWENVYDISLSPETAFTNFYNVINNTAESCFPEILVKECPKKK